MERFSDGDKGTEGDLIEEREREETRSDRDRSLGELSDHLSGK